jgi:hypothetical protein
MESQAVPTISHREYFQITERSVFLSERLIGEKEDVDEKTDQLSKFLDEYKKKLKQNGESAFCKEEVIDFSILLDQ